MFKNQFLLYIFILKHIKLTIKMSNNLRRLVELVFDNKDDLKDGFYSECMEIIKKLNDEFKLYTCECKGDTFCSDSIQQFRMCGNIDYIYEKYPLMKYISRELNVYDGELPILNICTDASTNEDPPSYDTILNMINKTVYLKNLNHTPYILTYVALFIGDYTFRNFNIISEHSDFVTLLFALLKQFMEDGEVSDILDSLQLATNPIKSWINYLAGYSVILLSKSIYDVLYG